MPKSIFAWFVLAFGLLAAAPAQAFDIFALRVLGFSADGRYFGFMTYGPQVEGQTWFAEAAVIDTNTDRYVAGAPMRFSEEMKDDIPEDKFEAELKAFLGRVDKRAAKVVGQHKLSKPGTVLASVKEARVSDYDHTPDRPPPPVGVKELVASHPKLGDLKLKLETREIAWPKTSKLYAGKQAPSCAESVDWQKGAGFRLTLEQAGRSVVLQDDKTIPASRNCALDYGIVEVRAFDRADGKVSLAVIMGMHTRGHEGQDRLFLAVTRLLDR